MKKNRKTNKKSIKDRFNATGSSQNELRNRWIIFSVALLVLLLLLIVFFIFFFQGKTKILGIPYFANANSFTDADSGSNELSKYMNDYINMYNNYDYEEFYQNQISKPKEGEEIAEIYIKDANQVIKVKLFPEEAPEIVKQFKELVDKGFYNDQYLKIEKGYIAKTDTIAKTDIFQDNSGDFDIEEEAKMLITDPDLYLEHWETLEVKSHKVLPYNGALCADSLILADTRLTADFYIIDIEKKNTSDLNELNIPKQLRNLFEKNGGDPSFKKELDKKMDGEKTNNQANLMDYLHRPTFGHIFEGKEVIDKIINTSRGYTIEKIEIKNYKE